MPILLEAKDPRLVGVRKFARILGQILVAELPIGESGKLQHIDIVKEYGLERE